MPADGQARAGVVGDEPLGFGHRLQRTLRVIVCDRRHAGAVERLDRLRQGLVGCGAEPRTRIAGTTLLDGPVGKQVARGANHPLGLPQRRAPVVPEGIQRADVGQRHHLVAAQPDARDQIVERREARPAPRAWHPVVRAVIAEVGAWACAMSLHPLEHRRVVAAAFRADEVIVR